ncbi:hypothetical protein WJX75_001491 [Coccomyxa subellipsoidea]|uniref:TPR-like protein n=1 Tax=Coccomyxa subellipsoidea TaxID=248742 RepID=A0ABR2YEK7_9CHLO
MVDLLGFHRGLRRGYPRDWAVCMVVAYNRGYRMSELEWDSAAGRRAIGILRHIEPGIKERRLALMMCFAYAQKVAANACGNSNSGVNATMVAMSKIPPDVIRIILETICLDKNWHPSLPRSGRDASYPGRQSLEEEAQREYKKAMELYDKALAVNSHVEVRLTRAACILHLKDVPGAAKAYQLAAPDCKCLDASPHVEIILAAVEGEMLLREPREEVVMSLLQSALIFSSAPQAIGQSLYQLMNAHLHFKDPSSAEEHLEDIYNHPFLLNAFRNDIPCWQRERFSEGFRLAGDRMQDEGTWERAMHMYSLSLDLNPHNLKSLHPRAHMNLRLKLYGRAAADATLVINARGGGDREMLDNARRRRSEAYLWLSKPLEACADLSGVKCKSREDIVRLGILVATHALDGWKSGQ